VHIEEEMRVTKLLGDNIIKGSYWQVLESGPFPFCPDHSSGVVFFTLSLSFLYYLFDRPLPVSALGPKVVDEHWLVKWRRFVSGRGARRYLPPCAITCSALLFFFFLFSFFLLLFYYYYYYYLNKI